MAAPYSRPIRAIGRALIDTVLPPQDVLSLQGEAKRLWENVSFLDAPWCEACGTPFEYASELSPLCGRCTARRGYVDHCRAPLLYDDGSRHLVLSFKHGGRTDALSMFAAQMMRAGGDVLAEADGLVPVPLHPRRLLKRRYNQSVLLARRLSKRSGVGLAPDILRRTHATPSQGGRTAAQRHANVAGVFALRERANVVGKHLVLIDDVRTTGATLEACAKALKKAGARRVDAICLARVVTPEKLPT